MYSLIRKILLSVLILVLLLTVVLVYRAMMLRAESYQVSPADLSTYPLQQMARHLSGILAVKTTRKEGASAFAQLYAKLENMYPKTHQHLELVKFSGGTRLYIWQGRNSRLRPVLFHAHLDVVDVTAREQKRWSHAAFGGKVGQEFVWGRGALDDKAAVIALLESVERLLARGFGPQRPMYFVFSHDEETGGLDGAAKVAAYLRQKGVTPQVIIDEWSGVFDGELFRVRRPVALVAVAEKGYMTVRLTVQGDAGHASRPSHNGVIERLSGAILRLRQNPVPAHYREPVRQMFATLAPEMGFLNRMVFANTWLLQPLLVRQLGRQRETRAMVQSTMAMTVFRSGSSENQLPVRATSLINVRLLPGDSAGMVLKHMRSVIADRRIRLETVGKVYPASAVSSARTSEYRVLAQTIREVFPDVLVTPGLLIGTTDSRHYRQFGVPVYRFRPFRLSRRDISRVHGIDERVSKQNLRLALAFYTRLIRKFSAWSGSGKSTKQ